jgi:hypothetical protein
MGSNAPPQRPAPKGAPTKKKLNVILHGLVVYFEDDKEIVAYLPNLGPEHVYKAGTWLAETAIDEHADLKLNIGQDVPKALRNKFNASDNFFLQGVRPCTCGCENHTIYSTLHLPYPPEPIRSLGGITIPKDSLDGTDKGRLAGFQSATVQVLTYDFDDDADLGLGDHPWEPVVELDADGTTHVNLHIFSEPERSPNEDHVRHAFQAAMSVFAGLNLMLVRLANAGFVDIADDDDDLKRRGVIKLELEGLVQRRRRLDVLGRAIRESRDLNSIWGEPIPFLGGDPSTCAGSGVGRGGDS